MSVQTIRQNIIAENQASSLVDSVSDIQGVYQDEAVRATSENSIITKATVQRADVVTIPRANLQSLVQRVRKESTIATTSLYQILAEMPELDKTALPQIFTFLGELAALAGERGDKEAEELEEEGRQEDWGRIVGHDRSGHHNEDSLFDAEDHNENDFEEEIYQSFGKFSNPANKATAIAIARGYFEAKDANPRFLNALNAVSREFYPIDEGVQLARLAAAEDAKLATATLETSPAKVRLRYRKKLREKSQLGELFEELAEIGLESGFLSLFGEIGADLAGISQQSDRGYLRSLTVELKKLWQLKSVFEETRDLIRITEPHLSKVDRKPEPTKLTAALLYYCGKLTVTLQDARSLLVPIERSSLESQLVFANALRELHGRMPDGIWLTFTERLLQYNTLGELCFHLTEAEERLYEESKK